MEYLGKKQDEQGGYLVERDWQTSLMKRGEEESCYFDLLGNQATKSGKLENVSFFVTVWRHVSPSFQPASHGAGRSKSQSKVSTLLRNLITCGGAVDTKDSMIELGHNYNSIKTSLHADVCLEICKVDKLGGSTRTSADPWNQGKHQTARYNQSQSIVVTELKVSAFW